MLGEVSRPMPCTAAVRRPCRTKRTVSESSEYWWLFTGYWSLFT